MPRALLSHTQAEHKVSHLPRDPQQVSHQHRDIPSALSAQLARHRCLGYIRWWEGSTTQGTIAELASVSSQDKW